MPCILIRLQKQFLFLFSGRAADTLQPSCDKGSECLCLDLFLSDFINVGLDLQYTVVGSCSGVLFGRAESSLWRVVLVCGVVFFVGLFCFVFL